MAMATDYVRVTTNEVYLACRFGRLEMLKQLLARPGMGERLKKLPEDNVAGTWHEDPLHTAIIFGHEDVVRHLTSMPDVDVNKQFGGPQGDSPLTVALRKKRAGVVQALVDARADVEKPGGPDGFRPLQVAAQHVFTEGVRVLLEAGADAKAGHCDEAPVFGATLPMSIAAWAHADCTDIVRMLLDHGAELRDDPTMVFSPLLVMKNPFNGEVIRLFMERCGAELVKTREDFDNVASLVVRHWDTDTMKFVFQRYEQYLPSGQGLLLLQQAAESGADKLEWLLDHPRFANVLNGKTGPDAASLGRLLHFTTSAAVVELLVSRGADVNVYSAPAEDPRTVLEKLMQGQKVWAPHRKAMLETLLKHGADVNGGKGGGARLLELAKIKCQRSLIVPRLVEAGIEFPERMKGQLLTDALDLPGNAAAAMSMIKYLLDMGVSINHTSPSGETVLFKAMVRGRYSSLDELLALGADPRIVNCNQNTLLHAISKGSGGREVEAASKLIKLGLDPNAVNKKGIKPLDVAAWNSREGLTKLYLAHGADAHDVRTFTTHPNFHAEEDHDGSTVHIAAMDGSGMGMRTLIRAGVDVNVRDNMDRTPLHWARCLYSPNAEHFLREAGADGDAVDDMGNIARDVRRDQYWDLEERDVNMPLYWGGELSA